MYCQQIVYGGMGKIFGKERIGSCLFTEDYLGDWVKGGYRREWRNNVFAPNFVRVIGFRMGM